MRKRASLILLCSAMAFGSATVTPGARPGGARCAASSIEGEVSHVDAESKKFSVVGTNSETRNFKVGADTLFRIPGASKDDLKNAPLSKVPANAKVKVFYCT